MLPLNLVIAIVFWVQAVIWQNEGRERLARSLNVQLTYTLIFLTPIFLAELFTTPSYREAFPNGATRTLVVGLFFGLTGLAGVIVLIFSKTRMFAGEVLGHDVTAPFRIRFVKE